MILNQRHKRSPRNLLINQAYPEWLTGHGVFSELDQLQTPPPWSNSVDISGLDFAYHGHSGEKFVAPLIYHFVDTEAGTGELTTSGYESISKALMARYGQKWSHLWSIYTQEYDPLHTYTIEESGERDKTHAIDETNTRTPNLSETHTGTDNLSRTNDEDTTLTHGHVITASGSDTTTTTYGKTTTDSGDPTNDVTEQVTGFNSADFVDRSKTSTESHTDNVQTLGGSDEVELERGTVETNSGSDRTTLDQDGTENRTLNLTDRTTGTDTEVRDEDGTDHEEYILTKSGNMYRSPAELLSFDRDFWMQDYFSIVFSDIDEMITLPNYSLSPVNKTVI